jgi:hypothetical protein
MMRKTLPPLASNDLLYCALAEKSLLCEHTFASEVEVLCDFFSRLDREALDENLLHEFIFVARHHHG